MPYNPCIDTKHREELERINKEGLDGQAKLDAERKAYIEAIARHTRPSNVRPTIASIRGWVNGYIQTHGKMPTAICLTRGELIEVCAPLWDRETIEHMLDIKAPMAIAGVPVEIGTHEL